jgi:uncharacterized FlaG/YvyC family protein
LAEIVHIGGSNVPEPKQEARPVGNTRFKMPDATPPSAKAGEAKSPIPQQEVSAPPKQSQMSYAEISSRLSKVNIYLDQFEIQALYTVDKKSGGVQIKIVNQTTGEVIRKIPPYDVVSVLSDLGKVTGKLLNEEA